MCSHLDRIRYGLDHNIHPRDSRSHAQAVTLVLSHLSHGPRYLDILNDVLIFIIIKWNCETNWWFEVKFRLRWYNWYEIRTFTLIIDLNGMILFLIPNSIFLVWSWIQCSGNSSTEQCNLEEVLVNEPIHRSFLNAVLFSYLRCDFLIILYLECLHLT